jgi:hypothetical protein
MGRSWSASLHFSFLTPAGEKIVEPAQLGSSFHQGPPRSQGETSMRYFMSIIPPADLKPEDIPQSLMDAMGPWMEKNIASGALVSTGGFKPAEEGKRLVDHAGQILLTDGPYSEAKEVIGGYAVLEAADVQAASAIAREFLQLHLDNGLTNIALELREIAGGVNY